MCFRLWLTNRDSEGGREGDGEGEEGEEEGEVVEEG